MVRTFNDKLFCVGHFFKPIGNVKTTFIVKKGARKMEK